MFARLAKNRVDKPWGDEQNAVMPLFHKTPYHVIALGVSCLCLWGCEQLSSGSKLTPEEREAARARAREADEQRREQDDQRRTQDRQRDEARPLRERYDRYTTAELKLMHERYLELAHGAGGRDLNVKVNAIAKAGSDRENMERVIEIERELLRRWKAGDADAKLPQFEASGASTGR